MYSDQISNVIIKRILLSGLLGFAASKQIKYHTSHYLSLSRSSQFLLREQRVFTYWSSRDVILTGRREGLNCPDNQLGLDLTLWQALSCLHQIKSNPLPRCGKNWPFVQKRHEKWRTKKKPKLCLKSISFCGFYSKHLIWRQTRISKSVWCFKWVLAWNLFQQSCHIC